MGEVKRLELWWQMYRTSLPVRDLENFRPMDFCWTECTYGELRARTQTTRYTRAVVLSASSRIRCFKKRLDMAHCGWGYSSHWASRQQPAIIWTHIYWFTSVPPDHCRDRNSDHNRFLPRPFQRIIHNLPSTQQRMSCWRRRGEHYKQLRRRKQRWHTPPPLFLLHHPSPPPLPTTTTTTTTTTTYNSTTFPLMLGKNEVTHSLSLLLPMYKVVQIWPGLICV